MKKCPMCTGEVQDLATKCRHCKQPIPAYTDVSMPKNNLHINNSLEGGDIKPSTIFIFIVMILGMISIFGMLDLRSSLNNLREEISSISDSVKTKSTVETFHIYYGGKGNSSNNTDWLGPKSLKIPGPYTAGATGFTFCGFTSSTISSEGGGRLSSFFSTKSNVSNEFLLDNNYLATLLPTGDIVNSYKIEIQKWNGSDYIDLSDNEKDALYFSNQVICTTNTPSS